MSRDTIITASLIFVIVLSECFAFFAHDSDGRHEMASIATLALGGLLTWLRSPQEHPASVLPKLPDGGTATIQTTQTEQVNPADPKS